MRGITEERADEVLRTLRARVEPHVRRADAVPERLGAWRIGEPLGRGGMGAVFRAVHERTGKTAAIKIAAGGTAQAAALRLETRSLAGLDHRGIVHVFDHGEDAGTVWMAVQLVEGSTLQALIRARPVSGDGNLSPLPRADCSRYLGWFRDLARALHAMHQRGLVHRDIKPANLIIADDDTPVVIDFGLSLDVLEDPIVDALAGTAPYMSPEQVLAIAEIDGRSDVYSLAATFFELLSGRPLVCANGLRAAVFAVAYAPNPRITSIAPELPLALGAVFERALAKRVGDRYANAHELAEDLELLLAGRGPRHARDPWQARIARHRWWLVGGTAALAAALALGLPHYRRLDALATLRARCAAARDATATVEDKLGALDCARRVHGGYQDDADISEVYARAITEFAPALTMAAFQRAALSPSNRADDSFAGQVGARAALVLASGIELAAATSDELKVQAMFAHLRAQRFQAARHEATAAAAMRDERIRLLAAIADVQLGKRHDVGDVVRSIGTDHANVSVDRLCCRAFLFLDTLQVPGGPDPEALRSLATALERQSVSAGRANDARNFVAGLLALVRLEVDEPDAAVQALESRLLDPSTGPSAGERPAMALLAAVATLRGLISRQEIERPRIQRLVEHLREACTGAPQLMERFQIEAESRVADADRNHLWEIIAAMFDEMLVQGPPPGLFQGPSLRLMHLALQDWYRRQDMRSLLAYADIFARETGCLIEPEFDVANRTFWLSAIHAAARDWPGPPDRRPNRDLTDSARCHAAACRLVPPPHIEFDAMLARQKWEARPDDQAAVTALEDLRDAIQQRIAAASEAVKQLEAAAEAAQEVDAAERDRRTVLLAQARALVILLIDIAKKVPPPRK